jgi:hypothetical protein
VEEEGENEQVRMRKITGKKVKIIREAAKLFSNFDPLI